MNIQERIEEIKLAVKRGIEQGLNIVSNTPLGVNVQYSEEPIIVSTNMSELIIRFVACDFKFLCRIPLWVNTQYSRYDLTSDGALLASFNVIRSARIDQWVFDTMINSQEYSSWVKWKQTVEDIEDQKVDLDSKIEFSLRVQHTKNRFTRIEGDEVWDYIEMPTDTTMKFVDPKSSEALQSARLEISFEGEELSIEDLMSEFRRQYVEKQ